MEQLVPDYLLLTTHCCASILLNLNSSIHHTHIHVQDCINLQAPFFIILKNKKTTQQLTIMQNRVNYSNAEHNDTSITVHLQESSYLVLFLTNNWVFGAKWLILRSKLCIQWLSIAVFCFNGMANTDWDKRLPVS